MRRFDETRTLDRLAEDGAIDLVIADELPLPPQRVRGGRRNSARQWRSSSCWPGRRFWWR
jgi:hypothetical protein